MSGNRAAELRLLQPAKRRDARVSRTRARLACSLRELMQRKPLSDISVQDVLDHARVSRSAFYAHFSSKVDLLLTDLDEFLEAVATQPSRSREQSKRVAVVAEFFAHVAQAAPIRAALARSGRLGDFYELARPHFARGIEQRLREIPRSARLSAVDRSALAHAFAGALMAQLDWWLAKGKSISAAEMDRRFHQLVWAAIPATKSSETLD